MARQATIDVDGLGVPELVALRKTIDMRLSKAVRDAEKELDYLRGVIGDEETDAPRANGSAKRGRAKVARKSKGGRAQRGAGIAVIKAAIEAKGGSAMTADLKDAYAKLGSSTPLSTALASYVKGGHIKKAGKGRKARFAVVA